MNSPTDTNQASEDELAKQIETITQDMFVALSEWQAGVAINWHSAKVKGRADLLALIRNEKLKLLAEVRERVMGEDDLKLSDIYGNDWRNNYGYTEGQVRDAANHLQRKQRESLAKLEAEL